MATPYQSDKIWAVDSQERDPTCTSKGREGVQGGKGGERKGGTRMGRKRADKKESRRRKEGEGVRGTENEGKEEREEEGEKESGEEGNRHTNPSLLPAPLKIRNKIRKVKDLQRTYRNKRARAHTHTFTKSLSVNNKSERDRAAEWVSFGQKWDITFCRHFRSIFNHCDVIDLRSYRIR